MDESREHATPSSSFNAQQQQQSQNQNPDAPVGEEAATSPNRAVATGVEQPASVDVDVDMDLKPGTARAENPTPNSLPATTEAAAEADQLGEQGQIATNTHDVDVQRRVDSGTAAQVEHANSTAAGLGAASETLIDPRPGDGARRVESPHQLPQLLPHPTQPAPYLQHQQHQEHQQHHEAQAQAQTQARQALQALHQHPHQHQHPHPPAAQPAPPQHPQPEHPPAPLASSAPAPASASAFTPAPQPQPQSLPPPHPYSAHPHPHQYPAHPHPPAEHAQHSQPQQPAPLPLPHPHAQQQAQPQTHVQIPPPPHAPQYHHHQQQQHHHYLPQQQPQPVASGTPVTPVTPLPPIHQHQTQFHAHAQPQPAPVLRSQTLTSHHHYHASSLPPKPLIMDPPRRESPAQQQQRNSGFPSPKQDYAAVNPKFVDDCTRMNFAIQQSLPEAVRRIVRDHWEKCLLGSEFHQAFVLNASIHHALPSITKRAVRDFGGKMVAESKRELMAHFTTEILDEVAELIISKASDSFLDKCLAERLLTIEAQPLVNALAKAERLGYEPNDAVESGQQERVIPQEAYPRAATAASTNGSHVPPAEPYTAHAQAGRHRLQCMKCFRTFSYPTAYDHHTKFDVCSQLPPTANGFDHSCPHCGQGFVHAYELQHHLDNQVCGSIRPPTDASRGPGRPPRAAAAAAATALPSSPAHLGPSSQHVAVNGLPGTPTVSTPAHRGLTRTIVTNTTAAPASTPGSTASPIAANPYAHLSEEQLAAMTEELHQAEAKYAPRFAEAEAIPDENARRAKVEGLRNSFGTKQSMIRKKYGVRLRERRTKAEITAERERLGLKKAEKERRRASAAATGVAGMQQQLQTPVRPVATAVGGGGGSGWTAANTPRAAAATNTNTNPANMSTTVSDEHDAKRRRVDESGGYQTPYGSLAGDNKSATPTRKTLSVSEMGGGLAGSSATAAAQDPTLPPTSSVPTRVYEQAGARVEVHEPFSAAGGAPVVAMEAAGGANRRGSSEANAVVVDDHEDEADDDDDSSSGDDEDIPSTLPSHVRKSLAPGGTSLLRNS